jgi:hypothetical protein
MYQAVRDLRIASSGSETSAAVDPESTARAALARVRKALTAFVPGMSFHPDRLRLGLTAALADAALDAERCFALGWLHWLAAEFGEAITPLTQAVAAAMQQTNNALLAESAYWRARVQILAGHAEAIAGYEAVLRTLGGAPQAIAWFVDLLWRCGRSDRAEQVWRSVRGNRKVTACAEGPLLEARSLLQRGDLSAAEKALDEAHPGSGVVVAERALLLAWIAASRRQPERAAEQLDKAGVGLYPASALGHWRTLVEKQARGEPLVESSRLTTEVVRGLTALGEGRLGEAATALRAASQIPAVQLFARYGLVCLGVEDAAALLAATPGAFLAVRCRTRAAVERFRRRECNPAELLDAIQNAADPSYYDPSIEPFRRLAQLLQRRTATADELGRLVEQETDSNIFRVALELAVRTLPGDEARELLIGWANLPRLVDQPEFRTMLGRQLLRLALKQLHPEHIGVAEKLLPDDALPRLVRAVLEKEASAVPQGDAPNARLWRAALAAARDGSDAELASLAGVERLRPLVQALRLHSAARRGDVDAVAALQADADAWRAFPTAPPRFVTLALEALTAAQPMHPLWRRGLPQWLSLWGPAYRDGDGARLAAVAGLSAMEAPTGVPKGPWLLHQAARAASRDQPGRAHALVQRALDADASLAESAALRDAMPELERRARAEALAGLFAVGEDAVTPALLVDAVDLLGDTEAGKALLQAHEARDQDAVSALAARADLQPRLAHHLALLEQRKASSLELSEESDLADPHWRLAWRCWLRFLPALQAEDAARVGLLLDHLLAVQRQRVKALLSSNAVERARGPWALVQELPGFVEGDAALAEALKERVSRFRDDLAAEYLAATREAMRYGDIAEGMRADYELGLGHLRRLLSLDRDNPRLLTALVEICGEWFLDLYNAGCPPTLAEQVERFTPFAVQLARLVEDRAGELTARAALAEYYKFRGFVAVEHGQKAALYREALRIHPGNENVRQLLTELEGSGAREIEPEEE